jgi:hypothetical protein
MIMVIGCGSSTCVANGMKEVTKNGGSVGGLVVVLGGGFEGIKLGGGFGL